MELFAADGHDAGGCERVTGKSGMRPPWISRLDVAIPRLWRDETRAPVAAFFEEAPWATVYRVGDEHLVRIDPASIPAETGKVDPERP